MQCKSCNEDVPSKFTHAISINVCPLCGGEIVPIFLKEILNKLQSVLTEAKEYMLDIEDWLLTNYKLHRIADDEVVVKKEDLPANLDPSMRPQGKSGKGISVHRSDDDDGEDVEVDDAKPLNQFAKRAGVSPKMTSQKALEFIKGKAEQDNDPNVLAQAFLKNDNETDVSPMENVPLSKNELSDMEDALGIGIQLDEGSNKEYSRHMGRLKNLQRG